MINKYYPPKYSEEKFHCAHCNVFAKQSWTIPTAPHTSYHVTFDSLEVSKCFHCEKYSIWFDEKLIIPNISTAPLPHEDLPDNIRDDYQEAANIVSYSPRGAAALLRLAIQKLMVVFGEKGKDINSDIGSLVKKGLPIEVQQSLDILRVIGNAAVHPGEMDIRDDQETAVKLFQLINFIVEEQITRKKKINSLYFSLPENKRNGIETRDNQK